MGIFSFDSMPKSMLELPEVKSDFCQPNLANLGPIFYSGPLNMCSHLNLMLCHKAVLDDLLMTVDTTT